MRLPACSYSWIVIRTEKKMRDSKTGVLMKVPCNNCPNLVSCEGGNNICEKLEKVIGKSLDSKIKTGSLRMKMGRERRVPDKIQIEGQDLRDYEIEESGDEVDQESEKPEPETIWDQIESRNYKYVPPLDQKEYRLFKGYIDRAIPRRKKTIKIRFLAFTRCDSMANIARRANVSKQNVQKQFAAVISRMKELEIKEERFDVLRESRLTPKKLKEKLPVERGVAF